MTASTAFSAFSSTDRLDTKLRDVEEFTRRELPAVVRAVATNEGKDDLGLLGRLEVVIGHPPTSAQRFLTSYKVTDPAEAAAAIEDILPVLRST